MNTNTTTPAARPDVTSTGAGVRINAVNTITTVSDSRRDALKRSGNTRGQEQRVSMTWIMTGDE